MGIDRSAGSILAACMVTFAGAYHAHPAEVPNSCQTSGWDMSREWNAFAKTPLSLSAGSKQWNMPILSVDVLYALALKTQNDVEYLQPPGQVSKVTKPRGGMVHFTVLTGGIYRVTVDAPVWIDVATPSGIIGPSAYTGWHECSVFRKSVEYSLQAGQAVSLQFSGTETDVLKVIIEPPSAA